MEVIIMKKKCCICNFSSFENKEYYMVDMFNEAGIKVLGSGVVWGSKRDALVFESISLAKYYIKKLNVVRCYVKVLE